MTSSRGLLLGSALLLLVLTTPAASASAPSSYLTSGLRATVTSETVIAGYHGVSMTYNDTYPVPMFVFVYLDLTNSMKQTVFTQVYSGNISSHSTLVFFLPIFGVPAGSYTASVFAFTSAGVPTSMVTTLAVTV